MPTRKSLTELNCSVANTAELIADRWTVLILRDALTGVRRFDRFQASLGIARNVLTERLNRLVEEGVMVTRPYQERPMRFEYLLTDKGKDLFDVLIALRRFGDRWNPPEPVYVRPLRHLECGEVTEGIMVCAHCRDDLSVGNVSLGAPERQPASV